MPSTSVAVWVLAFKNSIMEPYMCTFLFQEDAAFRDHDGYVAVYKAFALFVGQGYGDVGVANAFSQRNAKYAGRFSCRNCQL
jgi:hypothetical protein